MTRSQESPRTIRDMLDALRQDAQAALARAERRLAVVDSVAKVTADLKARGVQGHLDITAGQIVLTVDLDKPGPGPIEVASSITPRPAKPLGPSPFASSGPETPKPALAKPVEAAPLPEGDSAALKARLEKSNLAAPAPPVGGYKTGAWSKREADDAMRWRGEGKTNNEIAAKLGRDPRGIGPKLTHMAKKRKGQPDAADVQPEPAPAPQPVEDATTTFTIDLDKAASGSDRLVRMHLRALGHVAPWTPALDLKLVEGLAAGDGLGTTAEALGIDRGECKLRWNELLPEVTIDGQTQLLATLRAVSKEAGAAE